MKSILNKYIAAIFLSFVGLALRFYQRWNFDLWGDELAQINICFKPWEKQLAFIREAIQFPGEHLLTCPPALMFGLHKWILATPHIIIVSISFYYLSKLLISEFKSLIGLCIALSIYAFNNHLIFHAFEIRAYSILPVFSFLSFFITRSIVQDKNVSNKNRFLRTCFIILCLLYHYYGSYILFFTYLYHLTCSRKNNSFLDTFILNIKNYGVSLMIALPIWIYFVTGLNATIVQQTGDKLTFLYIDKDFIGFTKSVLANLVGQKIFYPLLLGLFFPYFIPYKNRLKDILYTIFLFVIPVILLLISSLKFNYYFIPRLYVWIIPLMGIYLGRVWEESILYLQTKLKK